ncbi:MAG: hypothetical protein HY660_09400 [Armatimonadetes bacterium]|nr:hypothetical protein [Armatimonadota bacterium]
MNAVPRLLGLSALGLVLSAYVWYRQVTPGPVICIGRSCAAVIRSRYGRLLGIPNGALGVAYFGGLLGASAALAAGAPRVLIWPMVVAVVIATVLYAYLTYLQVAVLRALCSWCLLSAAASLLILIELVRML